MTAADLAERIPNAIRDGRGWKAPCSVHRPDTNRSVKWHDEGDRVLLRCHATCRTEDVMAGYGLAMADLFHHPHERRGGAVIIATYDYRELAGMVRYQTVRLEPKGFYQRRPDGRGGWINNLDGAEPLLYHLPELQGQRFCAGVEGEEDAATLMGLGLAATTNHGGAGKWRECHTEQLVRAGIERVYLFRDNDRAGAKHRRQVATSLAAAGLAVHAVDLPGLGSLKDKHGEDVSDWLRAGHTPEELLALLGPAPRWTPDADRGAEIIDAGQDPHDDRGSEAQGPDEDPGLWTSTVARGSPHDRHPRRSARGPPGRVALATPPAPRKAGDPRRRSRARQVIPGDRCARPRVDGRRLARRGRPAGTHPLDHPLGRGRR
jgi:5S rRNA maturation endonuclease (ribonuclease M5)